MIINFFKKIKINLNYLFINSWFHHKKWRSNKEKKSNCLIKNKQSLTFFFYLKVKL